MNLRILLPPLSVAYPFQFLRPNWHHDLLQVRHSFVQQGRGRSSSRKRALPAAGRSHEDHTMAVELQWMPLDPESLCAAPCLVEQTLCQEPSAETSFLDPNVSPRVAKDREYAVAVLDAWRQEESLSSTVWTTEIARVVYYEDGSVPSDSTGPLFGHMVRKPRAQSPDHGPIAAPLPGILLFHTAAGPQDIFLFYKAACLVNTLPDGCVVLIADLLSDGIGWGWRSDRLQYEEASQTLLKIDPGNDNARPVLRRRLCAAHQVLTHQPYVDEQRVAALGWCFGGHAILELGRMRPPGLRALATFHGVFDATAASPRPSSDSPIPLPSDCEVLVCHGTNDPFVSTDMIVAALQTLQDCRHTVSLLQLASARHGFTNPGQAHNSNPAFAYDAAAAAKAWRQTMALLERRIRSSPSEG